MEMPFLSRWRHFYTTSFLIAIFLNIEVQCYFEYDVVEFCNGPGESDEILFHFQNQLVGYLDFGMKNLVILLPELYYSIPGVDDALNIIPKNPDMIGLTSVCQDAYFRLHYLNISEILEPPWTSVYSRNAVKLNVKNTLICLVSGFFPPPVGITWTKNSLNVTDKANFSLYQPNQDKTFNIFSHLSFIPVEGDVYSCSVEHKALQQAQTKIFEVDLTEPVYPSVICGVGLSLGLLGLVTGLFFVAKGKKWI